MARLSPPDRLGGHPLTPEARLWFGRALNVTDGQGLSVEKRREIADAAFERVRVLVAGRWALTVGRVADAEFFPL